LIVTELAVISVQPDGLHLLEISEDTTLEEVLTATNAKLILPEGIIQTF